jgi:transcriptional regulator with XRE-family HTH domain
MNRIQQYRTRKGMTQQALANALGLSKPFICQLESGARRFTLDTLMDWKEVLHLTDEQLLTVLKSQHRNKKRIK